jgi:hypothetical protein
VLARSGGDQNLPVRLVYRTSVRYDDDMSTDAETGTRFSNLISDLGVFDDGELTDRFRELELVQRRAAAEMAGDRG